MRFLVRTLGCKANLADSLEIAREFSSRGWCEAESDVSVCIVNSCTVTDEADRQSRKLASRLSRQHPGARIVVTGCAAEVDPERLAKSAGIDYVIGNRDKGKLVDLVLARLEQGGTQAGEQAHGQVLGETLGYSEIASRHPIDREWPLEWESEAVLSGGHTRGFLKIQEGCNAFCTYCIIPYGRGPSRSLESDEVIRRVSAGCGRGVREIVLTGTNLGDYGTDLGTSFETLLARILAETKLERLRLSSLDPSEITPGILALMESEERLCPHFHVSLQSPGDRVLKTMKRKYGSRQARECLEAIARLKRPAFVGMDLIAGFPGESAEEFEETVRFLSGTPWSRLHVFPYSEREGTPATRLPGAVANSLRLRRAQRLREISFERMTLHYEERARAFEGGKLSQVLLERAQDGFMQGFSPDYLRVRLKADERMRNQIVSVRVEGLRKDRSSGEVSYDANLLD